MSDKEFYIQYCGQHPEIPLFQQAWWQACVAGQHEWNVILVRDQSGCVLAFLPYLVLKKFCLRMIAQPLLSQCNGVWADRTRCDGDYEDFERNVCLRIISKLKSLRLSGFQQFFPKNFSSLQLFRDNGYEVSERKTYVVPELQRTESVLWNEIAASQRRQIRKAQRNGLFIAECSDADYFYDFHTECLRGKGEKNLNSRAVEVALCREALKRGQGVILLAKNLAGETVAALFLVWDATTAYYLIPTYNPLKKDSGASSFIVWEAMLYARNLGMRYFDFEGGNQLSIGRFYKQFGSIEQVFFQVEKIENPILKLALGLKTR